MLESSYSVGCVATPSSNKLAAPPGHGLDQSPDVLLWDGVPLLLECFKHPAMVGWGSFAVTDASVQFVPQMLDGIHIRREGRSGQHLHLVLVEEGCGESGRVWSSVVLLELGVWGVQQWKDVGSENLVHIARGVQSTLDVHQWAPAGQADRPPHHDSPTSVRGRLIHTVWHISLVDSAVHPSASVVALQQEVGFVGEPDVSPVAPDGPATVLNAPLQPVLSMTSGENRASVRSARP